MGAVIERELILNFHGLGEPHSFVSDAEKAYWWRVSSFARLLDRILDRQAVSDPKVVITFDDGNASDAVLALPELAKRRLRAIFFVCAGRIGKAHYLNREMIKEMIDCDMTIGSHGMNHRDWRKLDPASLDVEIIQSRKILEDVTQMPISLVSIPFGSYDKRILRELRWGDWKTIYTSDGGIARASAIMKPRETLTANMQDQDLLTKFGASSSVFVRCGRALSRLYKKLR